MASRHESRRRHARTAASSRSAPHRRHEPSMNAIDRFGEMTRRTQPYRRHCEASPWDEASMHGSYGASGSSGASGPTASRSLISVLSSHPLTPPRPERIHTLTVLPSSVTLFLHNRIISAVACCCTFEYARIPQHPRTSEEKEYT